MVIHQNICPCCKQTVPMDFVGVPLPPSWNLIVDAVYRAGASGISMARLVNKVYADDPDGGPEDAATTLRVRIHRINKRLNQYGWKISAGGNHHGSYVLEKIQATPESAVETVRRVLR